MCGEFAPVRDVLPYYSWQSYLGYLFCKVILTTIMKLTGYNEYVMHFFVFFLFGIGSTQSIMIFPRE